MRIFASALLLVAGTVLMTFVALSFRLFPRPLSMHNPHLLVEALGAAGAVFFGMGARGLYQVGRSRSGTTPIPPDSVAAA